MKFICNKCHLPCNWFTAGSSSPVLSRCCGVSCRRRRYIDPMKITITIEGPIGSGASTLAALVEKALMETGARTEIVDERLGSRGIQLRREAVKLLDPRQYPEKERRDIANLQRTLVRRMKTYEIVVIAKETA